MEVVTNENVVSFSRDQPFKFLTHILLARRERSTKNESLGRSLTIIGGSSDKIVRRDGSTRCFECPTVSSVQDGNTDLAIWVSIKTMFEVVVFLKIDSDEYSVVDIIQIRNGSCKSKVKLKKMETIL